MVGVLQPGGALHLREEAVRLLVEASELPPLEDNDEPGDQGENRREDEDDLGLETGGEHQLDRRAGDRSPGLEDHRPSLRNQSTSSRSPSSKPTSGFQPRVLRALDTSSEL